MKFNVQIGRSARIYYADTIEADDLADAISKLHRHGKAAPDSVNMDGWESDGVDDLEIVETCCIQDEETGGILANYSEGDGWDTEDAFDAPHPDPEIKATDPCRNTKAVLANLLEQVYQMQGMFDDGDGTIAAAVSEAEAAC